jgi:hypothetical protein
MNPKFEQPDLSNLAAGVQLLVGVVPQVFQKAKILPALGADRLIPSTGNLNECVYREIEFLLIDQPPVHSRQGLFTDFPCGSVSQDLAFEAIMVGIFSENVKIRRGGQNSGAYHHAGFDADAYAAGIREVERPEDIFVRIELADCQFIEHSGVRERVPPVQWNTLPTSEVQLQS